MPTEKKPHEQKTDRPKMDIGEILSDLVLSGAAPLAHSAAETVVERVKQAAARLAPVEADKKKKAKKSAAANKVAKAKKAKRAFKSGRKKSSGMKTAKKSSKKAIGKKSKR